MFCWACTWCGRFCALRTFSNDREWLVADSVVLRDYLRDHSAVARDYERLKHGLATELAAINPETREAYARAKTDFIDRTVAVALRSGYPREFPQVFAVVTERLP